MNNLLKSAIRKHALANKLSTALWDDADMEEYAAHHGVTERDNLKSVEELVVQRVEIDLADTAIDMTKLVDVAEKAAERKAKQVIAEDMHVTNTVQITNEYEQVVSERKGVHKDYKSVLATIAAGVNLAAVGPAGSGKSTMFMQVAQDLGLDYYITGAVQQESKIMGYMDANGNYVRTPFRDAYENGGIFVFEEFDGSSARALLAANNATANEYTDFPDKMVKRHEKFVCVMAGNTFGTGASRQYVGRQQLDAATLDRFAFLEVGYDEAIELAAAKQFNDDAGAWVKRVQKFRAKVEAAGIKHVVSPRASIMGAKLLKQGMPEQLVVEMLLHKSLSADQIAQLSA